MPRFGNARAARNDVVGRVKRRRTVRLPARWQLRYTPSDGVPGSGFLKAPNTVDHRYAPSCNEPAKLYQRSKLKQTAAALNGVPSWNLTPRRRKNVQVRPSLLVVQCVASLGTTCVPPRSTSTRLSKSWLPTRNAERSPESDGSRDVGSTRVP